MPSDRTIWAGSERTPYLDGLRETCGRAFQPTGIRRMLCTVSWYGSWRDRIVESHPGPRHLERKRNVGRALGGRVASRSRLSRLSRRPENINSIISLIMEACVCPGRCLLRPCIATDGWPTLRIQPLPPTSSATQAVVAFPLEGMVEPATPFSFRSVGDAVHRPPVIPC